MDFEIKCYSKFSWGYLYTVDNKRREIWVDNLDDLKRKVSSKNLPWDDGRVPKAKGVEITRTYVELRKVLHHSDCHGARAIIKDTNLNMFNNNILP